jgi:signal transduction histidine kinase
VDIEFQKLGEERRLSNEVELALYRIAQEALSNVVRHAQAKQAELRIVFKSKDIDLEVSDNGVGFNMPTSPTDFAPSGHFGLLGIRERADLIGARLEVESVPGKGTKLKVRL